MLAANEELKKVEAEHILIQESNAELSAAMLALAAEASTQKKEDIKDPELRQQLEEAEAELKISRQRWRVMKGTASATIVGSGVDWASDPVLLDIVLDREDEED